MSEEIPAPDVDLSAPIYAVAPEAQVVPTVGDSTDDCDDVPDELLLRLAVIDKRLEALTEGINTIGGMMNEIASAFGQIMTQVQKGGIGSLLGGLMGGKKNDD